MRQCLVLRKRDPSRFIGLPRSSESWMQIVQLLRANEGCINYPLWIDFHDLSVWASRMGLKELGA